MTDTTKTKMTCAQHIQELLERSTEQQRAIAEAYAMGLATGMEFREMIAEKKGA